MSRILAVDPGEVRIGIALSDPTGTIARPLITLKHTSRSKDVDAILDLAKEHEAAVIVVGLALDEGEERWFEWALVKQARLIVDPWARVRRGGGKR